MRISRLNKSRRGSAGITYGLAVGLIAVVAVTAVQQVGQQVSGLTNSVAAKVAALDCVEPGDVCMDGTIFAGTIGERRLYVPGSRTNQANGVAWGGGGAPVTAGNGADSLIDGRANTAALLADAAGHPPADACATLTAQGHSDWYLPAAQEVVALAATSEELGMRPLSGATLYWSSTEYDNFLARMLVVVPEGSPRPDGTFVPGQIPKTSLQTVRCVRS